MGETMTLLRKLLVAVAGTIIANNLVWLGPFDVPAQPGVLQAVSAGLWAAGFGSVCVPWAACRTEPVRWRIIGVSLAAAYAVVAIGCSQFDSPLFAGFGHGSRIVEFVLVTWSLTGGLALLGTALTRRQVASLRVLERHEVADQIAPFARDPAFGL